MNWLLQSVGGQFRLVDIHLGRSADPGLEQQVLDEVGSYGRQPGRIGDVLTALLMQADSSRFSDDDRKAIAAPASQLDEIGRQKTRPAALPPAA